MFGIRKTSAYNILVFVSLLLMLAACGGSQDQETTPPPSDPVDNSVAESTPPPPPPLPPERTYPTTEEWISLPARIVYPTGGSRLNDDARALLREAHASMTHRTDIIRIRVEGHADGRGSTQANQQLGMERAQGVVDFMVGELGLPRELFELESHGDERPLTSETTPQDLIQNRRVEFSILVRRQAAP